MSGGLALLTSPNNKVYNELLIVCRWCLCHIPDFSTEYHPLNVLSITTAHLCCQSVADSPELASCCVSPVVRRTGVIISYLKVHCIHFYKTNLLRVCVCVRLNGCVYILECAKLVIAALTFCSFWWRSVIPRRAATLQ